MGNEVDVNEEALRAEAAAVDVGGDTAAPSGEAPADAAVAVNDTAQAEAFAERVKPVVGKVTRALIGALAPNWTVSDRQNDDLATSVSYALALWFPAELPPKYAALLMVGASVYGIVDANRDAKGNVLPRVKPRTDGDTAAA